MPRILICSVTYALDTREGEGAADSIFVRLEYILFKEFRHSSRVLRFLWRKWGGSRKLYTLTLHRGESPVSGIESGTGTSWRCIRVRNCVLLLSLHL